MYWSIGYSHFSIGYTKASWTSQRKGREKKNPNNFSTHRSPQRLLKKMNVNRC